MRDWTRNNLTYGLFNAHFDNDDKSEVLAARVNNGDKRVKRLTYIGGARTGCLVPLRKRYYPQLVYDLYIITLVNLLKPKTSVSGCHFTNAFRRLHYCCTSSLVLKMELPQLVKWYPGKLRIYSGCRYLFVVVLAECAECGVSPASMPMVWCGKAQESGAGSRMGRITQSLQKKMFGVEEIIALHIVPQVVVPVAGIIHEIRGWNR